LDIANISLQRAISIFGFLFDAIIVFQCFKYGKQYFHKKLNSKFFAFIFICNRVCFLAGVWKS